MGFLFLNGNRIGAALQWNGNKRMWNHFDLRRGLNGKSRSHSSWKMFNKWGWARCFNTDKCLFVMLSHWIGMKRMLSARTTYWLTNGKIREIYFCKCTDFLTSFNVQFNFMNTLSSDPSGYILSNQTSRNNKFPRWYESVAIIVTEYFYHRRRFQYTSLSLTIYLFGSLTIPFNSKSVSNAVEIKVFRFLTPFLI